MCTERQSLPGHTVTQQIAAFTIIIIQTDFMHVDQDHQLAWGVYPFSSQYTQHPHIFLNCFYQNNLSIHEQTNKQTQPETPMHRCFWWDSNNFGGELLVWVYRRVAGGLKVGGWSSYWEGQSLGHEWSWRNTPHFVGSERFNNMKRLGVAWIIHMDAEVVKNKDKNSEANYSSEDG